MQNTSTHHPASVPSTVRTTLYRDNSLKARFLRAMSKYRLPVLASIAAASAATMAISDKTEQPAAPVAAASETTAQPASVNVRNARLLVPVPAAAQVTVAAPAWADDARYAEVILNATTGEIIFDRNASDARHIASMTKVMTAYIVFEEIERGNITLDTEFTASAFATSRECSCYGMRDGRKMRTGDKMTVREALHALMAKSYNDVAAMVAEGIAGSEEAFAERMTQTAHRLGAHNTAFGSASGLYGDDGTALDVALIYNRLSQDHAGLYAQFFTPAKTVVNGKESDNCRLCDGGKYDADITGMEATGQKTGYRRASGFSIVAEFNHAGERYIVVTMGAPNDKGRHERSAQLARAALQI